MLMWNVGIVLIYSIIIIFMFCFIHTGKLQPVFIWREKPVLLALLSNLTIQVCVALFY